jgi:nicotinamidase-related amidase
MQKAIIIVDWEKEWTLVDSEYYIGSDLKKETSLINKLILWGRENQYKIIFMRHLELEEQAFQDNTPGGELIDELDLQESDVIIDKYKISSFYKTSLMDELYGCKNVIVCGALINACVRSLVSEAYDRDYEVTIVRDCCIAFDKETHEFTLKDIMFVRPEIKSLTLSDVIS